MEGTEEKHKQEKMTQISAKWGTKSGLGKLHNLYYIIFFGFLLKVFRHKIRFLSSIGGKCIVTSSRSFPKIPSKRDPFITMCVPFGKRPYKSDKHKKGAVFVYKEELLGALRVL